VFSPYYAWAGRRDPEDHCTVNVALYGPTRRWAMTERGRRDLRRSEDSYQLGRSSLHWDGRGLDVVIDERCSLFPLPLRGRVRLEADGLNTRAFELEAQGRHMWRPIAPLARVSVEMQEPAQSWRGYGYFDTNHGDEPLEAAFKHWTWSRARTRDGARVFYEAERRRAAPLALSLAFSPEGQAEERPAPPQAELPATLWRLKRTTRGEGGARVLDSLEDAPFYSRARIAHRLEGEDVTSMHESLDCGRFANPITRLMLPFRMPRRAV
jgi:carotenoid 1,2-hydratase